jgi:hypothetical protein
MFHLAIGLKFLNKIRILSKIEHNSYTRCYNSFEQTYSSTCIKTIQILFLYDYRLPGVVIFVGVEGHLVCIKFYRFRDAFERFGFTL